MRREEQVDSVDIREQISAFLHANHILPDGTILDYWNNNQVKYPELYALAKIIFAISPTQAMVERSFSTMAHIFNERRNGLSMTLLELILIIALNADLFYAITKASQL